MLPMSAHGHKFKANSMLSILSSHTRKKLGLRKAFVSSSLSLPFSASLVLLCGCPINFKLYLLVHSKPNTGQHIYWGPLLCMKNRYLSLNSLCYYLQAISQLILTAAHFSPEKNSRKIEMKNQRENREEMIEKSQQKLGDEREIIRRKVTRKTLDE